MIVGVFLGRGVVVPKVAGAVVPQAHMVEVLDVHFGTGRCAGFVEILQHLRRDGHV